MIIVAAVHATKCFFLIFFSLSFFAKQMNPASHAIIPITFKNVEKMATDMDDKKIELLVFSLFSKYTVRTIQSVTDNHIIELKIQYPVL